MSASPTGKTRSPSRSPLHTHSCVEVFISAHQAGLRADATSSVRLGHSLLRLPALVSESEVSCPAALPPVPQ